ncbi:olfactory receptor 1500-like [Hyla sarda]|uniref:olfactory receptor 1500-like n=1 Tax=Hyla sarda TaxID=327740 RepID=UPI0024C39E62|nr:olfactory receptor 1500-like [Hyla sarda]
MAPTQKGKIINKKKKTVSEFWTTDGDSSTSDDTSEQDCSDRQSKNERKKFHQKGEREKQGEDKERDTVEEKEKMKKKKHKRIPVDSSDDSRDISRGFFYLVPCLHLVDKYRQIYIQENNRTEVTEFLLLGFQVSRGLRLFLFCLFLVVYYLIICGNLLIITLVSTSKNLHTPMYFFISQLSLSDILLSTDIVPNLLHILLNNGGTMTFIGCITQLYFFCTSEVFECFLLTVMSYDRYVAICNPLRYSSIMTSGHCVVLTVICWLSGCSVTLIYTITTAKLNFCGPNIIDHIFCDFIPLLGLSCSNTFIVHLEMYVMSTPVAFIPTTIIVLSYIYIVLAILRIPSNTGRQKAFSTCSSHLIVVSIFYGTIFSVYIVPTNGQTLTMSKILSLLYTVFTPLVNPIIYSLRNDDINKAVQKTLHKRVIW